MRPTCSLEPNVQPDVAGCVPCMLCLQSGLKVGSGGALELVAADITQRQTLLPEMFQGVTHFICCTAVKVGGGGVCVLGGGGVGGTVTRRARGASCLWVLEKG